MREAEGQEGWRAPAALIGTVLVQAASALIWAGATSARIEALETRTVQQASMEARTIRLEEQVRQIGLTVDRVEAKLDRLGARGGADARMARP